jgi:hypothetical protein
MTRMLLLGVVLLLIGRIALLEARLTTLSSALERAREWPCRGRDGDPVFDVADYGQRLQRAVQIVQACQEAARPGR